MAVTYKNKCNAASNCKKVVHPSLYKSEEDVYFAFSPTNVMHKHV